MLQPATGDKKNRYATHYQLYTKKDSIIDAILFSNQF